MARGLSRAGGPLLAMGALLFAWALAEVVFALLLAHPARLRALPANLRLHLRNYHLQHERVLVQADAGMARYDAELFYTLKPGRFRFANREFDVDLQVNSVGLRDDEQALSAPETIVLGDSFAMGWGVPQEAAFPQRLAALSGLRVLNAGVSSYGTAREVKLLERLDTSQARYVVVQYDPNDYWENFTLERHAGQLPIRPERLFERTVRDHTQARRYYPGKLTLEIVRGALRREGSALETALPPKAEEARVFLAALQGSKILRRPRLTVIVFELRPAAQGEPGFIDEVRRQSQSAEFGDLRVLDLQPSLGPENYFDLDDHLRASGHEIVARELLKALISAS